MQERIKHVFQAGKVNFLLDGNAGSSGKGKFAEYLVDKENVDFLITSNSANASHTVVKDGKEYVFKALPSGSVHHEKLKAIYIVDGASFEVDTLLKEIEMVGIPRSKVRISPRAGIIMQADKDYEAGLADLNGNVQNHNGTIKTGTTASGSGSVLAKKVLRNSTLVTAGMVSEIQDMISPNTSLEIMTRVDEGETGFFEIGQGFPLSNNHHLFAPHTTSRNVTVSSALNDAFLPPYLAGNVVINFRTFPIKIHSRKYQATEDGGFIYPAETTESELFKSHTLFSGFERIGEEVLVKINKGDFLSWYEKDHIPHTVIESNSGDFYPDQEEISWEELNNRLGNDGLEIFECTTLTKLPRRIAEFSVMNLDDAILHNRTNGQMFISVNFVNYVDKNLTGVTDPSGIIDSETYSEWEAKYLEPSMIAHGVKLAMLGTGADSKEVVDFIR